MRPASLIVIHEEHQALAAMLRSLSLLLAQSRREGRMPNFEVLRAMLFYIDEFPERLHHTKESQLLFPRLRERCPELGPVLDALDADHAQGEQAIRRLEHALLAFEMMGEPRRAEFEAAAERYIDFYLSHMGTEENTVLPAAEQHLRPEDWAELDAAFLSHRDPLTGHPPEDVYQPLFSRILNTAPAPIGLGE
ncbi:hemerythrin domain-containing protein [Azohydromonas caseinilytica]|uniref:Hemerythrin domain-containing protein n=1 Tax=Azohydromonas caseinilytica TaxID=2728836 RepID=A0A848FCV6_9BURK|nr:hemerythrin domain-containing protein [Azohydromonas caseinilytica]NML16229.1 hemerythrin domain-containing protein [Azohydromonas caseinilytica]